MEALEIAIKMELEGKEFYRKASEKSRDPLGTELFAKLAEIEDRHAETARRLHDSLKGGGAAGGVDISADQGKPLKSLFAKATKDLERSQQVIQTEIEAIKVALGMEEKSRKFYEEHSTKAKRSLEKRFFRLLAAEERDHYLTLTDYQEYLTNPAGWFAKAEHISVDGG